MENSYLAEFIELGRIGSFTKAAGRLGVSRATLSKHIAVVEREFGVTLFDRDNLHTELTPAGKALFQSAQIHLDSWNMMHVQMNEFRKAGRSTLRVGLFKGHKPTDDLVDIVDNALQRKGAHINVETVDVSGPCFDALRNGEYDLVAPIHADDADLTGLEEILFLEEPLVAIVSSNHPFASKDTLEPEDLEGNTVLTACGDGLNHYSHYIVKLLGEKGIQPRYASTAYCGTWNEFIRNLAFIDGGVYLIHASVARWSMPLAATSYKAIPFNGSDMKLRIYLTWRQDDSNPGLMQFVEEFRSAASNIDFSRYWK